MNNILIISLLLIAALLWLYIWKTNVLDFGKKPKSKPKRKPKRKPKAKVVKAEVKKKTKKKEEKEVLAKLKKNEYKNFTTIAKKKKERKL